VGLSVASLCVQIFLQLLINGLSARQNESS
jgi:hypothetical protein